MKIWTWVAAVAAIGFGGGVAAQSLERSYAQLCTGKNKSSETCRTLRKALSEKLASDSETTATPPVASDSPAPAGVARAAQPYRGKKGVISPKWGFWSRLAGATTVDQGDGSIRSYAWVDKGRVLGVDILGRAVKGSSKLTLMDDGTVVAQPDNDAAVTFLPAGGGSFADGDGDARWHYYLSGKTFVAAEEKREGGEWKPTGTSAQRKVIAAREVAAAKARVNADRMAFAAQVDKEWGPLGRAIGKRFLSQSKANPSDDVHLRYAWRDPGKVAELQWFHFTNAQPFAWTRYTRDPATGTINALGSDKRVATVSFDGDTIRESSPRGSAQDVIDTIVSRGAFERSKYIDKKGKRKNETSFSYADVTATPWPQLSDLFNRRVAAAEQSRPARQPQQAQQQQANAAPKKKGNGGLFGALGGAMLGAIMSGGDVGSMVGGAAKGMAIVDPNSAASGALGSIGDSLLSKGAVSAMGGQSGVGSALSKVVSGSGTLADTGLGGGGQYPNLAEPYCPGMTAANYRTFALSGGNDQQLKTLCGTAFEYWHMTQNAVRQGYGPQDVERTYSAHRDAAAVVKQFVAEAR